MAASRPLCARANRGDLERRERLAVPALASVALAALVFEEDDLLAKALLEDLGFDGHALHRRLAHLDAAAVVREQQRTKCHLGPSGTNELLDAKGFPFGDPVLLSSRCDDGVHVANLSERRSLESRARVSSAGWGLPSVFPSVFVDDEVYGRTGEGGRRGRGLLLQHDPGRAVAVVGIADLARFEAFLFEQFAGGAQAHPGQLRNRLLRGGAFRQHRMYRAAFGELRPRERALLSDRARGVLPILTFDGEREQKATAL